MLEFVALAVAAMGLGAAPIAAGEATDLARAYYAALETPSASDSLDAFFVPDYVDHDRPAALADAPNDKAAILMLIGALAEGFPDGRRQLNLVEAVGPDMVLAHFTFTGTHKGAFFGIPATGRVVRFSGIDILRLRDGRIVEQWHAEDVAGLISQLTAP